MRDFGDKVFHLTPSAFTGLREVRMELSFERVSFLQLKPCGFLLWIPAYIRLYVQVVLLDAVLQVIPFFAAAAVL